MLMGDFVDDSSSSRQLVGVYNAEYTSHFRIHNPIVYLHLQHLSNKQEACLIQCIYRPAHTLR